MQHIDGWRTRIFTNSSLQFYRVLLLGDFVPGYYVFSLNVVSSSPVQRWILQHTLSVTYAHVQCSGPSSLSACLCRFLCTSISVSVALCVFCNLLQLVTLEMRAQRARSLSSYGAFFYSSTHSFSIYFSSRQHHALPLVSNPLLSSREVLSSVCESYLVSSVSV